MPITPDTKNWTWVSERRCSECGFDASAIARSEFAERIRANAAAWPTVLERSDARTRPNDHTWSPLEYAAHVRDVHRIYCQRLGRFLVEADPEFVNWDQDQAAIHDRYNEQDPHLVGVELVDAAEAIASGFDGVSEADWARTASRSDGATFTLDSFARYYLHDIVHHLWDVKG